MVEDVKESENGNCSLDYLFSLELLSRPLAAMLLDSNDKMDKMGGSKYVTPTERTNRESERDCERESLIIPREGLRMKGRNISKQLALRINPIYAINRLVSI